MCCLLKKNLFVIKESEERERERESEEELIRASIKCYQAITIIHTLDQTAFLGSVSGHVILS